MVYGMSSIKLGLRLLALLLSCYGYLQYLRKYLRPEFCIGLLFSGIGSVLFLAGILNLLREAVWCIWLGGLLLAGWSVFRKESVKNVLCFGTVFFLVFAVFFLFLLPGSEFTHYDNFSHWALVSRIVTQQSRFPNYNDCNIMFPSYPLGSASFLFFITETAGRSTEWMQMYAQAILMVGMLVSLFAFARGPVQSLATAVCAVFLLCGNGKVYDLLVDCLLPLTALSAIAAVTDCGENIRQKLWVTVPYALFLVSIKNSGVLFVLLLYGYLWLTSRRQSVPLKTWLTLLAAPAILLLLWQKHVQAMFYEGMLGKHSLSISYYRSVFGEKGLSDIRLIAGEMAGRVFSVSNPALWLLLAGLLLLLLCKRFAAKACPEMKRVFLLGAVSYVLYQIGTLGMYLFSMPVEEALVLAGYDRYHQTILLFLIGLLLIGLMRGLDALEVPSSKHLISAAVLAAALVLSYRIISPDFSSLQKQQLAGTERQKYDQLIAQYDIPSGGSYLVLTRADRNDAGYLYHLTQYLLNAQTVKVLPGTKLDTIELSDYDYVIVFEETEEASALMTQLTGTDGLVACLRSADIEE